MKAKFTLLLAVACALVAMSVVASTAQAGINHRICWSSVTVRQRAEYSAPPVNFPGVLYEGQVFEVTQNVQGGWDYGYAYGGVHAYGYIPQGAEC
jgi:hypothetical protein